MPLLNALKKEETQSPNTEIFEALEGKIGMVPNIYASMANSPVALKAILEFGETLKGGSYSLKEVEAIALAIAEQNSCQYCLSAHTAIGKSAGFSDEETLDLRQAKSGDAKLQALVNLTKDITVSHANPSQENLDQFFAAGYDHAAFVELIGLIALNTFTNYFNHINNTEVDFPQAEALAA